MLDILQYFKERFPPLLAIFLSFGYAAYLVGIWTSAGATISKFAISILLIGISFLCLLLRQRILDEFKDFKHDNRFHAERPLQRGLVTKSQLIVIGAIAFAGELISITLISPMAIVYYIPVLLFSFLMAKEFFIPKWLKAHQTAYFISHQSMYIILTLWASLTFQAPFSLNIVLAAIAIICIMAGAEIVRKYEIRKDSRGKTVNDTYITMWGLTGARTTLEFMVAIPGIAIAIITANIIPAIIALAGVLLIEISANKQSYTRAIAALIFLIQAVMVIIL